MAKISKQSAKNTVRGAWHNEVSLREEKKWDEHSSCNLYQPVSNSLYEKSMHVVSRHMVPF